jgi:L-alanine-DL-glutamate epimerase-like enolase superfamily enzyme
MKTSTAPASDRTAPGAAIVAVRARRLASGAPVGDVSLLPDWAHAAVRPAPVPWPENREQFVVEVVAADGVVGRCGPCTAVTVQVIRDQIAPVLVGRHPRAHRTLTDRSVLGRHRAGGQFRIALSAARLALLDLSSRLARTSVCALLGGPTRTKVPCYASALGLDINHPVAKDVAAWLVEQGFYGQKWTLPGFSCGEEPAVDAARLAHLRDAVGPGGRLMVDALGRWSLDYAVRMSPILADLGIAWLEEPLDPLRSADLRRLHTAGAVPIAAGEHAYDAAAQLTLIGSGLVDIWQPDVGWQGGLADALTVADFAAAAGLRVFPHGGSLATATALAALTDPEVLPAVEYHLTQEPVRQQAQLEPPIPDLGQLPVRDDVGIVGEFATTAMPAIELAGGDDGLV